MDKKIEKDSCEIDIINESYHEHKRYLQEVEMGIKRFDAFHVRSSRIVVGHVESVTYSFSGKTRLILENEIIFNLKGTKWYTQYLSASAYYRANKIAYRKFLKSINK